MKVVPVPGIYASHKFAYAEIDAVNQSTLKRIGKSPLHYQHIVAHGTEETEPMRLGNVAHCVLLEPENFPQKFEIWAPEGKKDDFRGNDFTAFEARATLLGRTVIKQRERDAADRIRMAIHGHKPAQRYLAKGRAELTMVWRDKATGVLCKARIDWLSESVADVMCEFKTARDVSPWAFEAAFARREYDVQTAFYCDGYEAITGRALYGKCIAVENVEPHDVIVYDLAEVIDVGREIYRENLARLIDCRRNDYWPGQEPTQERTLRLPRWRDPEDETLDGLGLEEESAS